MLLSNSAFIIKLDAYVAILHFFHDHAATPKGISEAASQFLNVESVQKNHPLSQPGFNAGSNHPIISDDPVSLPTIINGGVSPQLAAMLHYAKYDLNIEIFNASSQALRM